MRFTLIVPGAAADMQKRFLSQHCLPPPRLTLAERLQDNLNSYYQMKLWA